MENGVGSRKGNRTTKPATKRLDKRKQAEKGNRGHRPNLANDRQSQIGEGPEIQRRKSPIERIIKEKSLGPTDRNTAGRPGGRRETVGVINQRNWGAEVQTVGMGKMPVTKLGVGGGWHSSLHTGELLSRRRRRRERPATKTKNRSGGPTLTRLGEGCLGPSTMFEANHTRRG